MLTIFPFSFPSRVKSEDGGGPVCLLPYESLYGRNERAEEKGPRGNGEMEKLKKGKAWKEASGDLEES